MPDDLSAKFLEKQKTQAVKAEKKEAAQQVAARPAAGGANPAEVKDLKIKLSHKDKEIREL